MAERDLPDAANRRRAATDFETNLVVLAGAGTGKTSLLVERALNAIGTGQATMQRIGAITFTEKAAGEMRERLAAGLDHLRALARGEIEPEEGHEAGRAFLWQKSLPDYSAGRTAMRALAAMEQLDGGTVTTIHGFCSELLRAFPVAAGVDPGFSVDNGERTDLLLDAAWESFVGRELGAEPPRAEIWRTILDRFPFESIAEVARGSSGFGIPAELLRPPWAGASAPGTLTRLAEELAERTEAFLQAQIGLSNAPLGYLRNASAALRTLGCDGPVGLNNLLRGNRAFRDQVHDRKRPKRSS
jgi:ATP-dependent helicase/nuclease subunit A